MIEVKFTREDELRQASDVARFLTRHPRRAKIVVTGREQRGEIGRRTERRFELRPHRSRRGDADLLANDCAKEGRGAAIAVARFGQPVPFDCAGKCRFATRKCLEVRFYAERGVDHQATLAA